jgi:hypothetical protein
MADQKIYRLQWYVAVLAALFAVALLAWEYTHGGVVSHHFLDRRDMPAVFNWWGLVVLPVLGWLASWSVLRRAAVEPKALRKAFTAALGALLAGVAMSVSFITGHQQITSYVFFAALLSGLVLRTYRAEYVFSFVLGTAVVFGMVLPTIGALVAVGISAAFHLLVRPSFVWAIRRHAPDNSSKRTPQPLRCTFGSILSRKEP